MTASSIRRLHVGAIAALCCAAMQVDAQSSGGSYRVAKSVIAGGGGSIGGGSYRLTSTPGQTATAKAEGASYVLLGGFWTPTAPASDFIFANGFDP